MIEAITDGNLNRVQAILTNRDNNGIPIVDVNHGFGNAGTALLWALWQSPINEEIIGVLLDLRDYSNNPIIDVNHVGPHGQTALSFVLKRNIEPQLRRRLLQRFLDVRGADGQLITNVHFDQCNVPLLKQAQELEDIHCLRILLDVRNADGSFALDINEVRYGTTLLDAAMKDGIYYRPNQEIIELIRAHGGERAADIPLEERNAQQATMQLLREQAIDRYVAPMQPRQQQEVPRERRVVDEFVPLHGQQAQAIEQPERAEREIQQFNDNAQNTHDRSVTQTAKGSLVALDKLYREELNEELNEEKAIREIRTLLSTFDYNSITIDSSLNADQKHTHAMAFYELLESKFEEIHSYTGLRIRRVLALVWMGVKDNSLDSLPEDIRAICPANQHEAPEYLIQTKKSSFIEKFIEGDRVYRERGRNLDVCTGGSIHKLLEVLNKAHTAVTIVTGEQAVKPAANDMAIAIVGIELRNKSLEAQAAILANWNQDDSIASGFKSSMVEVIDRKLKDHFGTLLSQSDREKITAYVEALPRPALPHKELNALVDIIENNLQKTGSNFRKEGVEKMHHLARNLYLDNGQTNQQKFEFLSLAHQAFIALDDINQQLNDLPNNIDNEHRLTAIADLKAQAQQTYLNISQEKLEELFSAHQALIALDDINQQLNDLPNNIDNAYRLAAIADLKVQAQQAYRNNSEEKLEELSKKYKELQEIDEVVTKLQAIGTKYASTESKNDHRLTAIANIEVAIKNTYLEYQHEYRHRDGSDVLTHLLKTVKEIREAVQEDHKSYGALRFLGMFQPASRLVTIVDEALDSCTMKA